MELNPRLDEVVHIPIRIPSAKDSVFHMATSDAVVRAMCIASLGQKRASKVFNLVPQHSKTCEWHIMEGMKHLRISGVQMRWRTELETREGRIQLLERRVARGIRPYLAYISTGVRFENSSVNEVIGADWHDEITEALPQTLLAFAIKKDFSTTFPSVSAGNFIPKT